MAKKHSEAVLTDDELRSETTHETVGANEPDVAAADTERETTLATANDNEPSEAASSIQSVAGSNRHGSKFGRLGGWCRRHKIWSPVLALLVVIIVLAAIPFTRYALAGTVFKQTVTVAVTDTQTHQPVSNASLTLGSKTVLTNGQGEASLKVPVGSKTLSLSKKYYAPLSEKYVVPFRKPAVLQLHLTATGRQVPITVTNKITGQPLENAVIKVLDTDAKTDATGHAIVVLPASKTTAPATVSLDGYNMLAATVQVTAQTVSANNFSLTPSGSVYFLSNLSGKIDVVAANLDGSDRKTVLAGTGKENVNSTILLASRDWKYLALLSTRDGSPKLYLITTANNAVTTMDEGTNVDFGLAGWSGDTFVYTVTRGDVQNWQANQQALKSFNASTGKLATLDQTAAFGDNDSDYLKETFGTVVIFPNNEIVYAKNILGGINEWGNLQGWQAGLDSVSADGSNKKTIKSFSVPSGTQTSENFITLQTPSPASIYVEQTLSTPPQYYEYENGQLKSATDVSDQTFGQSYPTYLLSPSGSQTFWSDARDGKNTLFLGDAAGNNPKTIASLSDYQTYGWYTDDYLLVSKNGSELYIMPVNGGQPLKISDYYKVPLNFRGYGGGYGGL